MIKEKKHHSGDEMEVYVVQSHNNGMATVSFKQDSVFP